MKRLILILALGVLAIGLQAGDQGTTNPKATCPMKDKASCSQMAEPTKATAATCPMKDKACCSEQTEPTKATAAACPMKQASCCADQQMTGVKNQKTTKVAMSPKAATDARK